MRRILGLTLATVMVMTAPAQSAFAAAADVLGVWTTEGGKSSVQIEQAGGTFGGKIIGLKDPTANGKPKLDQQNPNKALRSRTLQGLQILKSLSYKDGMWVGGSIYNPTDGKTYSCQMKLKDKNTLELRGYVMGMPALGKSQIWKRK